MHPFLFPFFNPSFFGSSNSPFKSSTLNPKARSGLQVLFPDFSHFLFLKHISITLFAVCFYENPWKNLVIQPFRFGSMGRNHMERGTKMEGPLRLRNPSNE